MLSHKKKTNKTKRGGDGGRLFSFLGKSKKKYNEQPISIEQKKEHIEKLINIIETNVKNLFKIKSTINKNTNTLLRKWYIYDGYLKEFYKYLNNEEDDYIAMYKKEYDAFFTKPFNNIKEFDKALFDLVKKYGKIRGYTTEKNVVRSKEEENRQNAWFAAKKNGTTNA